MKPALDYGDARDLFDNSEDKLDMRFEDRYEACLESFMDRQGYEWNGEAQEYRDQQIAINKQIEKDRADMDSEQAYELKAGK